MTNLAYSPQPLGCSRDTAIEMIVAHFVDQRARELARLLRPAIRLWPGPLGTNPETSRLGGAPAVPAGWSWPSGVEGPLLFLAQINCAELYAAVGSTALPDHGLLLFFGDYEEVNGCGPLGVCSVQRLADGGVLQPALQPPAEFRPLGACGLSFFATAELPDWQSETIAELGLTKSEMEAYHAVCEHLTGSAQEADARGDDRTSKLFGWPDLVQRDLGDELPERRRAGETLLLQLGWYHDGSSWECWGPGGHVYFMLDPDDLVAGRFDETAIEVQCS